MPIQITRYAAEIVTTDSKLVDTFRQKLNPPNQQIGLIDIFSEQIGGPPLNHKSYKIRFILDFVDPDRIFQFGMLLQTIINFHNEVHSNT